MAARRLTGRHGRRANERIEGRAMHGIELRDGAMVWAEMPDIAPGPGELLIANRATAINRADLVQRQGGYPPPPGASPILGLECAGDVIAVGEGVNSHRVGDRVCALLAGGGYADRVVVPAGQAVPIPAGLDYIGAASLPEVYATAFLNLFMEGQLQLGERVLLHAGASGVGTAAIQLCKAFGSPCWVTAGSDEKIARCVELGAEGGANRHGDGFKPHVATWTDGKGFDVILDPVGARYFADNIAALALEGRLLLIGLMGGAASEVNLGQLMMKRLKVIGSTLRARPIAKKADVMDHLRRRVWPLFATGEMVPIVDATFPITQAEEAHALVASDATFGKVVLTID
jgi:putative PIG3 family NAD(P)H quinone oxidoreductase